jgi:hypothetical protein
MTTVKVLDTLTALNTVLKAALSPTPVLDGPGLSESSMAVYVVVGHDDDPDANEAAAYRADFDSMESVARIELGSVNCYIVAQSGGADMATVRVTARDTAAAVDTALRADPTLGGVVGRADYGASGVVKQESNTDGIAVLLTFTVDYQVAT